MTDELWTIRDLKRFARVRDTRTINAMIDRGDLPPASIGSGRTRRWLPSSVRNFVADEATRNGMNRESSQNPQVS